MTRTIKAIVLLFGLTSGHAWSATTQAPACPVTLNATVTSDRIVAGEPVMLTVVITNRSDQRVKLDLGIDQTSWLNLRVFDSSGKIVSRAPSPPRLANTFVLAPGDRLGPGESWQKTVVVTKGWVLARGGTYRVEINVDAPCSAGLDNAVSVDHLIVRKSLDIHVAGPSALTLRRTAERLASELLKSRGGTAALRVDQLLSMPDYITEPILRQFVFGLKPSDIRRQHIKAELERLATPLTIQLANDLRQQEREIQLDEMRRVREEALRAVGKSPG